MVVVPSFTEGEDSNRWVLGRVDIATQNKEANRNALVELEVLRAQWAIGLSIENLHIVWLVSPFVGGTVNQPGDIENEGPTEHCCNEPGVCE